MKLPNADRAVVALEKLRGYVLNTEHPEGKHKARVFESVFGITAEDAEELQVALLAAARNDEVELREGDVFGQRYMIDFEWKRGENIGTIRSGWIVRAGEDFPRLTSCYVKL